MTGSINTVRHRTVSALGQGFQMSAVLGSRPYIFQGTGVSVGWSRFISNRILNRGKSGLRGKGCQVTPGHGEFYHDGKCHRKQTTSHEVRVKRWGKSPPRRWQHGRHGKPQLEQGQDAARATHLAKDAAGRLLQDSSDRIRREMTVTVSLPYRTRLIDSRFCKRLSDQIFG